MRMVIGWVISVATGLALWAQPGCASSKPSRYYLLSAMESREPGGARSDIAVGIGPIEFPKHLERPQIVTRGGGNRVELAEFDRWAEPLEENFAGVLAENLSILLSTDRVVPYPWKVSTRVDYQVSVTVNRFDATEDGNTVLQARWAVLGVDGQAMAPARASRITEPAAAGNYDRIVQAGSRAVEKLSRQIASSIQEIQARRPGAAATSPAP